VVFVHHDDIAALGFDDGDQVDLVSEWEDGTERSAPSFRIVEYDTPRGCAAAYFPEVNPLVPLDSTARGSNCPTSKSVVIRLERPTGGASTTAGSDAGSEVGADKGHKSDVEPTHLS
jgi:formate dehydrogenase major subunit